MDVSDYKEVFASESAEHLQALSEALLGLEQDSTNEEYINQLFRSAHTLKGMAATMGYTVISDLTHKMESSMEQVRDKEVSLTSEMIDVLFECLDTLEALLEDLDNSNSVDIEPLKQKLEKIKQTAPHSTHQTREKKTAVDFSEAEKNQINEGLQKNLKPYLLTIHFDDDCLFKSARVALVLRKLEAVGEILKTMPDVKDIEDEKMIEHQFQVVVLTAESAEKLKEITEKVSEIAKTEVSEILFNREKTAQKEETKISIRKSPNIKSVQSVRVSIERLDALMDLVGELVINKIRLLELSSKYNLTDLEETVSSLDRLTTELQEEIMSARMVPIQQIFNRFPRMVRDLAKKEGKKINLIIEGGEIELDRTVLDEIGEPLVHILRNSVDHGIETPEVRKQSGKNEIGIIKLVARREKNHVLIQISDDGKGIDPEKCKRTAIEKGIISEKDAEHMTPSEAVNLCFKPGFSTAETVTAVSGRGVGMDVVKTSIKSLGGTVRLESKPGEGTTITLKLPITVAIVQSLMVEVSGEIYAIPITNVVRDMRIRSDEVKTIKGEKVVVWHGEIIPLIYLGEVLSVPHYMPPDNMIVVVVERGDSHLGLVVDRLLGQQEVIIKNLESSLLHNLRGIAGATILGDGSVSLILDVATLV
jgi:two-component system chemotaxis sensor kinase CheA